MPTSRNDEGLADLHVHTNYSDGLLSPGEVIRKAVELGLKAVAITDHDCIEGIGPALDAAAGTNLEVIPGVEMSAAKNETEIHILGYFIDWREGHFADVLRRMRDNRLERMKKILRMLSEHGVNVNEDEVFGSAEEGTLGRLHLARVMVKEKVVRDTREAFDRYIGDGKPCHVRHERLDYRKAISLIINAGGVPVLAHPGTMGRDEYIPDYVDAGLRGIEVYHTEHRPTANDRYIRMSEKYGLVMTGGSDCHGSKTGEAIIGTVTVGYEVVEALRREAEKLRGENK